MRRLLLLAGLVVSLGPSGVRAELATATFARGCFWCMEPAFEGLDGVVAASAFCPAAGYHQRYHHKSPMRYRVYRWNCGRDQRLKEPWGDEASSGALTP